MHPQNQNIMTQEQDIKNAIEAMRKGGVILYPTDTVWGIGCDATNAEAVKRVYEIKQRDDSKALICLVDSDARLQRYVRNVPDVAWQLIDCVEKPTTLILDGAVNLAPNLIAEDGSIGIRITKGKDRDKILKPYIAMGRSYATKGDFFTPEAHKFAGPETFPWLIRKLIMLLFRFFENKIFEKAAKEWGCTQPLDYKPY